MASWLQAQLKVAENLLEAVDRTVSGTAGSAQPGGADREAAAGAADVPGQSQQVWQQQAGLAQQGLQQGSGSPLLPVNVSRGLSWLQGSPQPSSSPAQGSPAHPAAAAATQRQQQQQQWQPYMQQQQNPPSGSPASLAARLASKSPGYAGSPVNSRASPAANTPSSAGAYTMRTDGPFSAATPSSSTSGLASSTLQGAARKLGPAGAGAGAGSSAAVPRAHSEEASSKPPQEPAVQSQHAAAAGYTPAGMPAAALPSSALPVRGSSSSTGAPGAREAAAAGAAAAQAQQDPKPADTALSSSSGDTAMAAAEAAVASAPGTTNTSSIEPPTEPSSSKDAEQAAPLSQQQQQQQQQQGAIVESSGPAISSAVEPAPFGVQPAGSTADAEHAAPGDAAVASSVPPASVGVTAATGPQNDAPAADEATTTTAAAAGAGAAVASTAGATAAAGAAAAAETASPGPAAAAPASGGSSTAKEAQLTRLVETLRKRLEVVRGENQQLEDMLHEAEQRSSVEQSTTARLTAELAGLQREQEALVASAAANAAAQDAHIGRLQAELESSSRQVAALQAELQAAHEQHVQAISSKDSMEGGALDALRAEVATYESQLESERKAHAATKAAAASRERDLEEQLGSSSEALAAIQRQLEDAASRAREAEEQQMMAAAEAARLQQQVQQLGAREGGGEQLQLDPQQQLQLEAEREAQQRRLAEAEAAVAAAVQAQRGAEARVSELQQELSHLQSSYQAQAASRGAPQLEQQLRELQELLYQKQQQLERLSGEKQAQQLLLERQIASLKSELGKAHAAAAAAVTGVHMRGSHDIIPMDALGEPYQRLARHNKLGGAVQATANFLDTTAASASQLLRQQPLARLIVFLYIVLIHLYVYFLLARMQKQALSLVAQQGGTGVGPELMAQGPPAPAALSPPPPVGP